MKIVVGKQKHNLFYITAIIVMIGIIIYGMKVHVDYSGINTQNISYEKAKVLTVVSEDTEKEGEEGILKGIQELEVKVLSGIHKGEVMQITNRLSVTHSIYANSGQRLVICIDQPAEDYYLATVYNYDHTMSIYIIVGAFIAVLIVFGGKSGLRSVFALLFTFVMLIFLLLPLITKGMQPVLATAIVMIPIILVSLLSLLGFTRKTLISVLGTISGIILCCALFFIFSKMLKISGYNTEEAETLVVISKSIKLHIKDLLFAGVMISSLGAVMDISVTVASSICEIYSLYPERPFKELFKSGLRVGQDVTGTTANTLILAFTGSFFITLYLFRIYSVSYNQFMNMDSIAIEITQALTGTIALALTSPLTAYLGAQIYCKKI